MSNRMIGATGCRRMAGRFAALVALLLLSILAACGDATPTAEPVATAYTPAATAVPATVTSGPSATIPASPAVATEPARPTPSVEAPSPTATGAPAPTAASTPVPTTAATAEPTPPAVAQFVSDEHQMASMDVFSLVVELIDELGHRESATPEEHHAADLLKVRFDALGYKSEIQPFTFQFFDIFDWYYGTREAAMVSVQSPVEESLPGILLTTTPNGGENSGPLTPVDLAEDGLSGKIALIQPDEVTLNDPEAMLALQDQVNGAGDAGALAAIITGPISGIEAYRPLMAVDSAIPALILLPGEANLLR